MTSEERKQFDALEAENRQLQAAIKDRDRFIRGVVMSYLSDEIMEEVIRQQDRIHIGGERREVTIMFADLRKSTELSEKMDASGFITMLNHFLGEMIEIINSWQGNILSFVGDAIVTVFGAPRENTEAARDAVACAVAMQRRIPAVNEWNAKEGYPALSMGIGIHTGEAILGTIGSQTRAKYDMIGRNVNLASRIEGFTGSGQILISSETMKAAGDLVVVNTAGEKWVQPKGIHEQVLLHDVVGYGSHRIRPEV